MIYITGTSVTRMTKRDGIKTYPQILKGKLLNEFQGNMHNLLYTALTAEYETRELKLKKNDIIVFNFGMNDCIKRERCDLNLQLLDNLCGRAVELGETDMLRYFQKVRKKAQKPKDGPPFQAVDARTFRKYCKLTFERFPKKAIVLTIPHFPKDSKRMGQAFNEIKKTNKIMEEEATRAGVYVLPLHLVPDLTYNHIHLTELGHKDVAAAIKEARKCL